MIQFSQGEIFEAALSLSFQEPKRKLSFTSLIIDLDNTNQARFESFKRGSSGVSYRSSIHLLNCPHGKTRNCEICENKIDRDLNDQIVRENDIRVESCCDSEIFDTNPITASDLKASSLN